MADIGLIVKEPAEPRSPTKFQKKQSPLEVNISCQVLQIVIAILKKTSRQRTEKDLEQLVPLIRTVAFFIERDIKDEDFSEIVACLTYEPFKTGETVFDWGTLGDKFYILLQGSVKVLVPIPGNKEAVPMIEESTKQIEMLCNQIKVLQKQIDEEKKQKEELEKLRKEQQEQEKNLEEDLSTLSMSSPKLVQRKKSFRKSPPKSPMKPPSPPKHTSNIYHQQTMQQTLAKPIGYKYSTATQVGVDLDLVMNKKSLFNLAISNKNNEDIISEDMSDSEFSGSRGNLQKNRTKELTLEQKKQLLVQQIQKIKDQTEASYFLEVVQLKTGKSFGELALIKNKPRAATIKCLEQCHLAVMSKLDYQKVLQRIEQKNLNKILDFLNMLPFLQSWSRNALVKLQYAFESKTYLRNSFVYKEGESAGIVYIIKEGEFELMKRVKPNRGEGSIGGGVEQLLKLPQNLEEKKINTCEISSLRDFIKHRGKSTDRHSEFNSFQISQQLELVPKKKKVFDEKLVNLANTSKVMSKEQQANSLTSNSFQIAQIGAGQLFGEEDVIAQRNYSCSVVCKSKVGEVFAIKADEFIKKFKSNTDSWGVIVLMSMAKERAIFARVKKIKQLLSKSEGIDGGSSGLGLSLMKETQLLLNKNELDLRQRFKEIIEEYPSVDNHRKILHINQKAIKEKEKHNDTVDVLKQFKKEDQPVKRTIEISFERKPQQILPEISLKNPKRSLSPAHKPIISTSITNAKQTYISSKVSDMLQSALESKDLPKTKKQSPKIDSSVGAFLTHQGSFSGLNTSIIIQPKQQIGSVRNSQAQLFDHEEHQSLTKNVSNELSIILPKGLTSLQSPKYDDQDSRNQGTNFIASERSRSHSSSYYNTQPNFLKQEGSYPYIPQLQIAPPINSQQAYFNMYNRPPIRQKKKKDLMQVRLNKSLQGVGSPTDTTFRNHQMINVVEYSSFHPNSYIKQSPDQQQLLGQKKKSQGGSILTNRQRYMSVAFTLNPLNPFRLQPAKKSVLVPKKLKKHETDELPQFSNQSIQMFTPKLFTVADDVLQMIRERKDKVLQLEVKGESRLESF